MEQGLIGFLIIGAIAGWLAGNFMKGGGAITEGDVGAGLKLTAHFIERRVLWPTDRMLPDARTRMIERLAGEGRL